MKTNADNDLLNNLKSIILILGFILGKVKKIARWRYCCKMLKKTYKSSDYSTTFTASRVAWVAKERDNTVELAFGGFLC